jgi:hypothetical protein
MAYAFAGGNIVRRLLLGSYLQYNNRAETFASFDRFHVAWKKCLIGKESFWSSASKPWRNIVEDRRREDTRQRHACFRVKDGHVPGYRFVRNN